jgi:hypothetical protein
VKFFPSSVLIALAAAAVSISAAVAAPASENAKKGEQVALSSISFTSIAFETSAADSNYTVIDSRFDETAAAGALFGLLGASLNSGINAGEDNEKADRFREAAAKIDLVGIITKSVNDMLTARADPPVAASREEASHVLHIEIRNWGLIRSAKDDPRLRGFINLSWKILDADGKTVFEKKRENAVSPTLRPLDEYTNELLTADIETLAAKTGPLIAYQIVYR